MVGDYGTHLKTLHHRDHTVKLVKEKKKKQSRKEEESRGSRHREEMMQTKEKSALYHTKIGVVGEFSNQREGDKKMQGFLLFVGIE